MKLKCIQDETPATNGILGLGAKPKQHIKGLTKGKVYVGQFVPQAFHVMNGTEINAGDIYMCIFNDDEKWWIYDTDYFAPADE